jgi:hypothetical protein
MRSRSYPTSAAVARVVRQFLDEGKVVEIDGLGTFRPAGDGGFAFVADAAPRAFIAYVEEELAAAERMYRVLAAAGIRPWLDRKKLMPGQNWPRAIERAIGISDFFIPCFSRRSVSKRGQFQSELRYALECADRLPLDDVFIIPVRLDDCPVPASIKARLQYVDMFPDWNRGLQRVLAAIGREGRRRRGTQLLLAG